MANDSTRSSAMSDVCEHTSDWLFAKVVPTGYLQSDPHWLFAKQSPLVICKVIPTSYLQSDPHWLFVK